MKDKIKKWLESRSSFYLNEEDYHLVFQRIKAKNIYKLKYVSLIVFCLFLGLYISTFAKSQSNELTDFRMHSRSIYLFTTIITAISFIMSVYVLPHKPKYTLPLWYMILTSIFVFAIWAGVFGHPEYPAVTFCVFLLALPILIVDRPLHVNSYLFLICFIFILLSYHVKDVDAFSLDVGNCLTFFFLSVAISSYMRTICIKEAIHEILLEEQRDIDKLSSLYNKACFERKIKTIIHKKGVLLIIDIDDFKTFNDTYGHIYGDGIIHEVGLCLAEVFNENCLIGRFGGDEFVIYSYSDVNIDRLKEKHQCLIQKINESTIGASHQIHISLSCGGAIHSIDGYDYMTLFQKADERLYDVKRTQKGIAKFK